MPKPNAQSQDTCGFPPLELQLAFAKRYANWDKPSVMMFSSDIDFVPDYMLQHLLDIIEPYGVKWTFFVTHDSPILSELAKNPNYELAIHPYNDPSSTQGTSFSNTIENLSSYCSKGEAVVGNRFHRLKHGYNDFDVLAKYGIRYDVSTLQLNLPFVLPAWHHNIKMTLVDYTWEDGSFESTGLDMDLKNADLLSPGVKIFSFHPLNLWINGPDFQQRKSFLKSIPDLLTVERSVAEKFQLHGLGSKRVLCQAMEYVKSNDIQTMRLRDFCAAYEEEVVHPSGLC